MSRYIIIGIFLIAVLHGCKKDDGPRLTGTDTIDNILYSSPSFYYAIGFSFELGEKVKTETTPGQDITVHALISAGGLVTGAKFDTPNLVESFALAGEFDTGQESIEFYESLTEVGNYTWTLNANDLQENQVWVFKTREGNYVKIRIVKVTISDEIDGPYARVTFRWRIQPDGTATFPAE